MTSEEKNKLEKELSKKYNVKVRIKKFDRDYRKDPFFVKKLEDAKKLWSEIKFPEGFFEKKPALL